VTFYTSQDDVRRSVQCAKMVVRQCIAETKKATGGSYSRQIVAAYMITTLTAPGESYVQKLLRYKMSMINTDVLAQIDRLRERLQL
jgi:hypothetical protein